MAKKVYIDFELRYKEAVANLDEMQKEYAKLEKQVDKTTESQEELGNILDSTTGGAISKFKNLGGTIGSVVKSFKNLRVAILASGIGALVLALGSLVTMFKTSEEGQNRFAKLMTQIGVVTGNVTDIVGGFGDVIYNVFTGNFQAAREALDDVTEAMKNFGEETKNEIKLAGQLADARAKADKVERRLLVDRAEADRKRAELLEKAVDREQFSTEQRIEFLKEAGRIDQEITQQEIQASQLRLEAKQLENSLGKSTKEDLDEEAQLKANLIQLETARLSKQKEVTSQTIALLNEQRAAEKAIQDEKDAEQAERDKLEAERQAQLDADKKARDERVLASELDIENRRIAAKKKVVDQAIALFGAETAAGKAALIAKQLLNAQELISEARKTITFSSLVAARSSAAVAEGTAQTAKIGFPQNIPMLIGYALQAVGIIGAITQAVGKSKSVAGGLGGGSAPSVTPASPRGAAQSQSVPPAFNIVGASDTNQLAEAIGGQAQQPVKAYVVSNDVSTAQELDRNIVEGASIG